METYVPKEPQLPHLPEDPVFDEVQWKTLLAIADVVIPALTSAGDTQTDGLHKKAIPAGEMQAAVNDLAGRIELPDADRLAREYLQENASSIPQVKEAIRRAFIVSLPPEVRQRLSTMLSTLNTRFGSLLLTGSATPFQDLRYEARERIFHGWRTSRLGALRQLAKSLTLMINRTWLSVSPTVSSAIGIPRVPIHGKPEASFEYEFLQIPPGDGAEVLETDVVIVGSGCGGGVAAKNLAEAGHRVLVVEKAYHYPSSYFPMSQSKGSALLYEQSGSIISDDSSITVLAGSAWGGGGTINWGASLQTQHYVREEWANSGLPLFTSPQFQDSLDRVCERMGVNSNVRHNFGNRVILEGSRKLGLDAKTVPQNSGHRDHYCGYCTFGCHSVTKQGPVASFLTDAAKAGAIFMEGFHAEKVLFESVKGKKVAVGVEGTWTSRDAFLGTSGNGAVKRKVVIKAKKVIVSAGSLNSPLLLIRSGIKNRHVGANLHLHPVLVAGAVFDEDVRPWEGTCLTTVVADYENLDGQGHGAKLEGITMMPSVFLITMPWRDGLQYKKLVSNLRHMTGYITLVRDRDSGRVYPDPVTGKIRISYTPSPFDRQSALEGLIGLAKIAYAMGAKEFHTSYFGMRSFIRKATEEEKKDEDEEAPPGAADADFNAWIDEFRSKAPLSPEQGIFGSAHQMGTCRMSDAPEKGVVDQDCRVWGTEGLYVADASVFPSASGVNPMITNMAIVDWATRKLARVLTREKQRESRGARL